jgi:hypothetical protein
MAGSSIPTADGKRSPGQNSFRQDIFFTQGDAGGSRASWSPSSSRRWRRPRTSGDHRHQVRMIHLDVELRHLDLEEIRGSHPVAPPEAPSGLPCEPASGTRESTRGRTGNGTRHGHSAGAAFGEHITDPALMRRSSLRLGRLSSPTSCPGSSASTVLGPYACRHHPSAEWVPGAVRGPRDVCAVALHKATSASDKPFSTSC